MQEKNNSIEVITELWFRQSLKRGGILIYEMIAMQ